MLTEFPKLPIRDKFEYSLRTDHPLYTFRNIARCILTVGRMPFTSFSKDDYEYIFISLGLFKFQNLQVDINTYHNKYVFSGKTQLSFKAALIYNRIKIDPKGVESIELNDAFEQYLLGSLDSYRCLDFGKSKRYQHIIFQCFEPF